MMKLELPKIGLRQIKTALSVFICLAFFQLMGRNPVYACIAAIVSMQSTLENSISVGVDRLIGTVIGGIIGLAFCLTKLLYYNTWLYFLLITIGIIVVIYCNIILKKPGSVSISCVVFLIIMVNAESIETGTAVTSFFYALNRIIDTAAGVIVGVAVNTLIKKRIYIAEEIKKEELDLAGFGTEEAVSGASERLHESDFCENTEVIGSEEVRKVSSDEDELGKEE